jgi:ATP-dependent Lon protease
VSDLAVAQLQGSLDCMRRLSMTGEITLRGLVTPVGGIKEKVRYVRPDRPRGGTPVSFMMQVLAAHRAGIRRIILPLRNRKDVVADLPAKVKSEVTFEYVTTIWQALEVAFGDRLWEGLPEACVITCISSNGLLGL